MDGTYGTNGTYGGSVTLNFSLESKPNPAFAGYNSEKAQYSDTPVLHHSASDVASKMWTGVKCLCPVGTL
jgi:hypothetical protein